jgi:hypothetical protein
MGTMVVVVGQEYHLMVEVVAVVLAMSEDFQMFQENQEMVEMVVWEQHFQTLIELILVLQFQHHLRMLWETLDIMAVEGEEEQT